MARVGIYDRGAPASLEYGEQAQAGMVTYTRETCSEFSHEVSSGRLAPFFSAAPDFGSTPSPLRQHPRSGPRRRELLFSSEIVRASPSLPRDKKRDGKTRGARQGAQILAGIALRPVSKDFPDTEICLRREPPHPREALPTSDIDFPRENRIEVYLRYSTDSRRVEEEKEGK